MTRHLIVVLALAAVHLTKKVLTAKTTKEVEMGASLLETMAMEEAVLQSQQRLRIHGGGSGRLTNSMHFPSFRLCHNGQDGGEKSCETSQLLQQSRRWVRT